MTPTSSSWSISVKTVGGSDSVKAAKASSIQHSNNNNPMSGRDSNQRSVNPDSASLKDPPVNLKSHHGANSANASMQSIEDIPSNFTVNVESSDKLSMLHKKIEEVTGLQASQQRLIYRGRLITKQPNNSSKDDDLICDIEGLCDGQTIHLVPRPLPTNDNSNDSGNRNNGDDSSQPRSNSFSNNSSTGNSTSAATSLIATLLGLSMPSSIGSSNNGNNNNNNNNNEDEDLDILSTRAYQSSNATSNRERRRQMFSISNSSNTSTSSRRSTSSANNNLSTSRRGGRSSVNAQNAGIWERNPIEPLRQGLMTLHTLLESHPSNNNNTHNIDEDENTRLKSIKEDASQEDVMERKMSYLEAAQSKKDNSCPEENKQKNRPKKLSYTPLPPKWYLGQWLDVKDTVDQWLEATIDKIVYYTDIFTPDQIQEYETNAALVFSAAEKERIRKHNLKVDPIVGAGDKEGCKTLFLEEMPNHLDEAGFPLMKFRDNYRQTQLILVHYNSWPHRWDEWIRGDSKRISIFRTKTRHPLTAPFASPTPNSHYFEAPTTHIYQDGEHDRAAVLPELCRAMNHVQQLLNAAIQTSSHTTANTTTRAFSPSVTTHASSGESNIDLPWVPIPSPPTDNTAFSSNEDLQEENLQQDLKEDSDVQGSDLSPSFSSQLPPTVSTMLQGLSREQLGSLAPILDRLGRTLTDAAPHIAELSSSLPSSMEMNRKKQQEEDQKPASNSEQAQIHESIEQVSTSNFAGLSANTNNNQTDASNPVLVEENERPENDLSSIERARTNTPNSTTSQQTNPNPHHPHADRYQRRTFAQLRSENNEPVDYSLSLVNTSRDENTARRSRHSTSSSSNQDPNSSFLGTYLAARGITEDDRDAGSTLARLLRAGSGGLSGNDSNGGGNNGSGGGGIDIHIHAIVTPVGGGGGMEVGIGLPDMGAFPFVGLQSVTQDNNSTSETEVSPNAGDSEEEGNGPIVNNLTVPDLNDDLFSDSYTESPIPFQFTVDEFGEEDRRVEENRSGLNESYNNTSEETFPLTAYSMVVGDIPLLPSDDQIGSDLENTAVASGIIGDEISNRILSGTNSEVSSSSRLPSQAQSIIPATSTNTQNHTSQATSDDNANQRGRRNGSALGRFARAFRRSSSSRGQGSSRR